MLPTKVLSFGAGSGTSVTVSGVPSVVETTVTVWLVWPMRLSSRTVMDAMSLQMYALVSNLTVPANCWVAQGGRRPCVCRSVTMTFIGTPRFGQAPLPALQW